MTIEDFSIQERLINREVSWLAFNKRVMEQSSNKNYPLLERLRFLSISGNNLDEFYMVRVAGLRGLVTTGNNVVSDDGLTPKEQLKKINTLAGELVDKQQQEYRELIEELRKNELNLLDIDDVKQKEKAWLEKYFLENVFPILTPLAIDLAHPFPFLPNLGFSLIVDLRRNDNKQSLLALLPIPPQTKRFIRLPDHKGEIRFISLENVLRMFISLIFPLYDLKGEGIFRIIRDSELEVEEKAEDLVLVFESALKRRRRGNVVRLEVNKGMPKNLRRIIQKELEVNKEDIMEVDGVLGLAELSDLIVEDRKDLTFKPFSPRFPQRVKDFNGDIFAAINQKDFVVHHPFESFDVVVSFIQQAAADDKVLAIKQTLYRTGDNSPIVKALIKAAEAGKSVTALVELKARFDEARNIKWAQDMERAGVQVVFGFLELKTHAKISVVIRQEDDGLKSYLHWGTGNYHPQTAKVYTDISFFTDSKSLGHDAVHIFNYLTGNMKPENLKKIAISPYGIRNHLMELIDKEIEFAGEGKPASIWVKLNALVDPIIIDKLYEASMAGVQIDMVVRGICCLRPGVKGLSENIRVKSIVGRFLEHARIACFGNGHALPSPEAKVFISSADWMPRNFDRRVEVLVPLENPTVHSQALDQIMVSNMKDTVQSWQLDSDGHYEKVEQDEEALSAHEYFMTNPSLSGVGTVNKEDKD
ncbi:RNA degradosome polyphosphate kinase [Pseudemcibacter aquimaris]|uniref:RNA degradosome polyphosphate kinase n=1 Tax=Pseudemcibacter aquimaris TaxID=2857064 RepID=UPI002011C26B|nr:RNA degradosome polyphosphate kinase [Pseudemcibacter aquimaris]MCC3861096.1 RNA degradosome polyphosphate kinase [Pseudemcibacter aquimaris]WDU59914.1 RNA degradosome polyphosphate kinase [Pseudemcibacter aquimaris]